MDHLPVRRTEKRRDRVDAGVFLGRREGWLLTLAGWEMAEDGVLVK